MTRLFFFAGEGDLSVTCGWLTGYFLRKEEQVLVCMWLLSTLLVAVFFSQDSSVLASVQVRG